MKTRTLAMLTVAALATAGCSKTETSGNDMAATIDNVVDNTTADLGHVAGNLHDSEQANAVVNEEVGLMEAGNAAANMAAGKP